MKKREWIIVAVLLAACIAAGVVKVGDDPHADAGFLREVEELLIDGMFLLFLRGLPVF